MRRCYQTKEYSLVSGICRVCELYEKCGKGKRRRKK